MEQSPIPGRFNGDGRVSLWRPATEGVQDELVSAEPARFFRPPMSARGAFSGWLGVFVDTTGDDEVDWEEVVAVVEDTYRPVAPRTLVPELDGRS